LERVGNKIIVSIERKSLQNRYLFKSGTVFAGPYLRLNIVIDRKTDPHRLPPARAAKHGTIIDRIFPCITTGVLKAAIKAKTLVGEIRTVVEVHRRSNHVPDSRQFPTFKLFHPVYFR